MRREELGTGKRKRFLKAASRSPGLPLGGVCSCHALSDTALGRSSDLQAAYLLQLPSQVSVHGWTGIGPVLESERSFLLTAAGQFRSWTGFPFQVRLAIHHRKQN